MPFTGYLWVLYWVQDWRFLQYWRAVQYGRAVHCRRRMKHKLHIKSRQAELDRLKESRANRHTNTLRNPTSPRQSQGVSRSPSDAAEGAKHYAMQQGSVHSIAPQECFAEIEVEKMLEDSLVLVLCICFLCSHQCRDYSPFAYTITCISQQSVV